jgi:membrane protease YdiL (CAAX protease family)
MRKILQVFLYLIIGYYAFIRFIFPILRRFVSIDFFTNQFFLYFIVISSYLCVFVLLGDQKENLKKYNLDVLSLILLVITGVIRVFLQMPADLVFHIALFGFSISLLLVLLKNRTRIPNTKGTWVVLGIAFCLLIIPLAFVDSFQIQKYLNSVIPLSKVPDYIIKDFLYNLSFGSLYEEIIFRSILWGYLRTKGWQESSIFWTQGLLFWSFHVNQISTPITFFIVLPIFILLTSILVSRSKQLFPAIVFHTAFNAFLPLIAMYISHL